MVSPLRIIYDNAANRASSLTASTTAGTLLPAGMLSEDKSEVWRSTSTSATLTLLFSTPEQVGAVILPFCNLTPTATIRVRGYINPEDTVAASDTGVKPACPYAPLGLFGWGAVPLGVNAFSFGGGTYASIWFAIRTVKKLVIDIVDTSNTQGYIEAARIVIGSYWQPAYNAEYGANVAPEDSSAHYRTDSGNLRTDIGTRYRRLSINMSFMTPTDRANFWRIVRGNSMAAPILISLFPENADPELEQTHQIYGKLSAISAITASNYNIYSAPVEIEEI